MAKKTTVKKPTPAKAKTPTTVEGILAQLESLGDAARRAHNTKYGAGTNQYGVKSGDLRTIAKALKTNHELALALWQTGNIDAQSLATLIIDGKRLTTTDVDRMVRSVTFVHLADWFMSYVVKQHADKERLRQAWMTDADRWAARAGWSLTAERVVKNPDGLDLVALLDRIEAEMGTAEPEVQWTMNSTLAEIGIHFPKLRKRALAIGETLGVYRDYPCSKGCTSPFAPIWIAEMVRRQA